MSVKRAQLFRVKARGRGREIAVDEHVECATIVDAIQLVLDGWSLELTQIVSVELVADEIVRDARPGR